MMYKHITNPTDGRNPTDKALAGHVQEIRELGRRAYDDVVEIGWRLSECKKIVRHGDWEPWLEREFGWSADTAINFMRVHELAKSRNFRDLNLPVSAIYLLAKPSTPDAARDEFMARAKAGEHVPLKEVKQVVSKIGGQQVAVVQRVGSSTNRTVKVQIQQIPAKQLKVAVAPVTKPAAATPVVSARNEELEAAKRQLEIKIVGLESEISELKKAAVYSPASWMKKSLAQRKQIVAGWGPAIVAEMNFRNLPADWLAELEHKAHYEFVRCLHKQPATKQREISALADIVSTMVEKQRAKKVESAPASIPTSSSQVH
jgi:predicted transcriptional regulator